MRTTSSATRRRAAVALGVAVFAIGSASPAIGAQSRHQLRNQVASCGQVISELQEDGGAKAPLASAYARHVRARHLSCSRARAVAIGIREWQLRDYGFHTHKPAGWRLLHSQNVTEGGWPRETWGRGRARVIAVMEFGER